MSHAQTLTQHRDIQNWVAARKGMPALVRAHDKFGALRSRLALRFERMGKPNGMPAVDQGATPISWHAWFAELDRQQLALRVSPNGDTEYELIARKNLN